MHRGYRKPREKHIKRAKGLGKVREKRGQAQACIEKHRKEQRHRKSAQGHTKAEVSSEEAQERHD